jgi:phosphatidylserine/phosphatidylglycerophosphate/cardiolipin synthase-like enzyme
MPSLEYLSGEDLYRRIVRDLMPSAKDSLLIATATLKATLIPGAGRRAGSIVRELQRLGRTGVEVRVLHSGVPSGPFLEEMKALKRGAFSMRRCPRTHFKAVIVDGARAYIGSANLTGAGLGAKSATRRNFEVGVITDDPAVVDGVADLFEAIWSGRLCKRCDRRAFCPEPLAPPGGPPPRRRGEARHGRGSIPSLRHRIQPRCRIKNCGGHFRARRSYIFVSRAVRP